MYVTSTSKYVVYNQVVLFVKIFLHCEISIYSTYPNRHNSKANKWVFVVASVSTVVTICAWQEGQVMAHGCGPNAIGATCVTITVKREINISIVSKRYFFR